MPGRTGAPRIGGTSEAGFDTAYELGQMVAHPDKSLARESRIPEPVLLMFFP